MVEVGNRMKGGEKLVEVYDREGKGGDGARKEVEERHGGSGGG